MKTTTKHVGQIYKDRGDKTNKAHIFSLKKQMKISSFILLFLHLRLIYSADQLFSIAKKSFQSHESIM